MKFVRNLNKSSSNILNKINNKRGCILNSTIIIITIINNGTNWSAKWTFENELNKRDKIFDSFIFNICRTQELMTTHENTQMGIDNMNIQI